MKFKTTALLTGTLCLTIVSSSQKISISKVDKDQAVIELEASVNPANEVELRYRPNDEIGNNSPEGLETVIKKVPKDNKVKWTLNLSKPAKVRATFLGQPFMYHYIAEPGDNIRIQKRRNELIFTGDGSSKYQLIYRVTKTIDSLKQSAEYKSLSDEYELVNSLNDYFAWNAFLNTQMKILLPILEQYKQEISDEIYYSVKAGILQEIERIRYSKFRHLTRFPEPTLSNSNPDTNKFGLTKHDLKAIYDSTLNGEGAKWLQFEAPFVTGTAYHFYLYNIVSSEVLYGQKGFFSNKLEDDSLREAGKRYMLYYNYTKARYKGPIREAALLFIFTNPQSGLRNAGFTPEIEWMLDDYYSQPGYPEFKKYVKEYELTRRKKEIVKTEEGVKVYTKEFGLVDDKNNSFDFRNLNGKISVVDFWFTGCVGCVQLTPAMKKVKDSFKNDTNVVFLNISIDKNKNQWIKSIAQQKYTTGKGINLYTNGKGSQHPLIQNWDITSYPTIFLINSKGKIISRHDRKLDPRKDNGKAMIQEIEKQSILLNDGPYIIYKNDTAQVYSINSNTVIRNDFGKDNIPDIKVQTDRFNKFLNIPIKKSLEIEPSVFNKPEKLFVLSDIEGNFDVLRKLLQVNNIIDSNYNWIFDKGHLVFVGDMFDRGSQVTECLWLIYLLEDKARAVGGYVHFILGNHEIMNLQGQNSYTKQKYENNAYLLNISLKQLYAKNSELGRWLRTKNIVEKIGDILFVHGGISGEVNELQTNISEINQSARIFYDDHSSDYGNKRINTIMSSRVGPFWYRGYYNGKARQGLVDSTLNKFSVNYIVTGHTIIGDTVSTHFENKVINVDTKHADGKNEALLIDRGNYFRVNDNGVKINLTLYHKSNDREKAVSSINKVQE